MKSYLIVLICVIATFHSRNVANAQLPVEAFFGHEKATIDIMFFKFFKNDIGQNSEWLFFNRNRASIDYKQTTTERLPQFGFTEAFSYNNKQLLGFAPVGVISVLNKGVFPKLGIQFAKVTSEITVFTWTVIETTNEPNVDLFLLARFTPKITNSLHLFTQLELVNAFATSELKSNSFVQRLRLGMMMNEFQFGFGGDFSQVGTTQLLTSMNIGGFVRYEF